MSSVRLLALACVLVGALAVPAARGGQADYTGAETCGRCHEAAFAIWRASAHARAAERLGQSPQRRCLGCHATGEAPAGQSLPGGVGCEACHGPGAGYAEDDIMRDPTLARNLGLRDLSTPAARAALCAECHRATTRITPFDPEAAYKRIQHP